MHRFLPIFLLLSLIVTGCDIPGAAPRQVSVLGGQIQVRAPQFYCVGQQTAATQSDSAVVLIGRCTENGNVAAALLTVTIGQSASGGVMLAGPERLRDFLRSNPGRRAMSRSGRAGDVQIIQSGVIDDMLLFYLRDRVVGDYWRAIVGIKGRLVTISATGAEGAPLTQDAGRKLVDETVAALKSANMAAPQL